MIHSRSLNNFEELHVNSVSIYHRNIQTLAIEVYKFANGMSQDAMNKIFQLKEINHHNKRHHPHPFIVLSAFSVYNGTKSVVYLGAKIWEMIPL